MSEFQQIARRAIMLFPVRWIVCIVFSGCATFAVGADSLAESMQKADEKRAQILIERLGSPEYRVREQAGRDLSALGARALPAMKRAFAETDEPEVERRLEVLVKKIEYDRLVKPTRITYQAKNATVTQLIEVIVKQSGYRLSSGIPAEAAKIRMSVEWKDTSFWEALDAACETAGIIASPDENEDGISGLSLYGNDTYNPYIAYSGPFRCVATNIGMNRSMQLSGLPRRALAPRQSEYLNFNFQLMSEPKNPILGYHPPIITKGVDDSGHDLAISTGEEHRSYYTPNMYRSHNQYVGVNLGTPSRNANSIKELRGKMTVLLLSDTRPEITVEKILTVKKKTFVSRTTELFIESVSDSEGAVTITLNAKQLHPNPEDYSWANTVYQRLEVHDAKGIKFTPTSTNNQNQAPGSVSMTVVFSSPEGKKAGKPSTLVLVEWIAVQKEIEFAFKDIPLP